MGSEMCIRDRYTDMSFETRAEVAVDEYVAMITGKTAVLVALAAELGALVAGADEGRVAHFANFGLNLGLAFQAQDDLLGIWGDEQLIGKSVSTDITTRKKTLPVLYALARSAPLRELYAGTDDDAAFVGRVVPLLFADVVEHLAKRRELGGTYVIGAPTDASKQWDRDHCRKACAEFYPEIGKAIESTGVFEHGRTHIWRKALNSLMLDVLEAVRAAYFGHDAEVNRRYYTDTTDVSPILDAARKLR